MGDKSGNVAACWVVNGIGGLDIPFIIVPIPIYKTILTLAICIMKKMSTQVGKFVQKCQFFCGIIIYLMCLLCFYFHLRVSKLFFFNGAAVTLTSFTQISC